MSELLNELLAFPTSVFTVLVGLSLVYWIFVILGAIGVETLDFDLDGVLDGGVDAAVDGVLDGAIDGALDGAVDGAVDGAMDGAVDGAMDGAVDGAADGVEASATGHGMSWYLVHALALQKAPATVVFSTLFFWSWVVSYFALRAAVQAGADSGAVKAGIFALSLVAGTALTNRSVRPLGKLFQDQEAERRVDAIGRTCEVRTGRVTSTFGQADVQDGGAGLVVEIRCDEPNTLTRGSRALVVDFDPAAEAYQVEPMDALLAGDADEEAVLEDALAALAEQENEQPVAATEPVERDA